MNILKIYFIFSIESLKTVLSNDCVNLNVLNDKQETPLLLSLRTINGEEASILLLKAGSSVHRKNNYQQTCLHVALQFSSNEVLKELISHGADVNALDNEHRSPLHYAIENDNLEAICMLLYYEADVEIEESEKMNPLIFALYRNRLDIAKELIYYYADFSSTDMDGCNALQLAMWHKSDLAFDLIDAGADCNSNTFNGHSAILSSLNYPNADLFKKIWPKVNLHSLLASEMPFLCSVLEIMNFSTEEWFHCFYLILESPFMTDLVEHCQKYFEQDNRCNLFSLIITALYHNKIELEDRLTVFNVLLSLGCTPNTFDLNILTILYGFQKECELFIYASDFQSKQMNVNDSFILYPQAYFIFSVKPDLNYNTVINLILKQLRGIHFPFDYSLILDNMLSFVRFFSMPLHMKQRLLNYSLTDVPKFQLLKKKLEKLPEFPTLLELSRNKTRTFIKENYKCTKSYHFHDVVKSLRLPRHLEQIVRFKTPIY